MSGPRNAEDRLRRLLVMLPYLMEAGEVPLSEVAERFDMTEAQVTNDLELVAMCGLPPYVDEMIDVFVDDGMVFVGVPRLFTRSLRLTAPEAFSLLAAGRAALELPGGDATGPLGRGLAKLAAALGAAGIDTASAGSDDTAGVAIDLSRPELTDQIIDAVAAHAELAVTYYTPARDAVSERTFVPRHVFVEAGNWYVRADDARSGELRTFRIDRIEQAAPTGRTVPPEGDAPGEPQPFFTDVDVPRALVRVGPDAQWIIDRYPIDRADPTTARGVPNGWLDVTLPVASERWLARLLVRLGPDAVLVEPDELRPAVTSLAQRMLARYAD
ncbi:helix-turn-helix transcriptional regulator [Ilumatobacter coccineus]|uniref:Putative proteasome accessory factor C n=1 Tax=Ilumatobacter coccineus (strain NBRC 103263 / KCTC 29153 / YM16-304) TaxID=1313172 RepID=A0A6C7E9A7_ILUCY|nr:WYL domain-containing protein [Ilumatobacter coccineus]BAN01799.1 putative proteasome accessory factor C [Ilumatobacter coccineus YM16-304]